MAIIAIHRASRQERYSNPVHSLMACIGFVIACVVISCVPALATSKGNAANLPLDGTTIAISAHSKDLGVVSKLAYKLVQEGAKEVQVTNVDRLDDTCTYLRVVNRNPLKMTSFRPAIQHAAAYMLAHPPDVILRHQEPRPSLIERFFDAWNKTYGDDIICESGRENIECSGPNGLSFSEFCNHGKCSSHFTPGKQPSKKAPKLTMPMQWVLVDHARKNKIVRTLPIGQNSVKKIAAMAIEYESKRH